VKTVSEKTLNILIMGDLSPDAVECLRHRHQLTMWTAVRNHDRDKALAACDVIIIRSPHRLDSESLRAAQRLRWVIRAGTGTDNIDLDAAVSRGIRVFTTPCAEVSVAELAIGLMIAAARHISSLDASLREGEWKKTAVLGSELMDKTVGIVGFGRVGRHVARLASGLGMRVLVNDRSPNKLEKQTALRMIPTIRIGKLVEILPECHFLILSCPLTRETRHLINRDRLYHLPRGAVVINVARGGVLDERALVEALDGGHIAAAGIDAFEVEPPTDSPLLGHRQVVATPHVGAQTHESQARVGAEVIRIISELSRQGTPTCQSTPETELKSKVPGQRNVDGQLDELAHAEKPKAMHTDEFWEIAIAVNAAFKGLLASNGQSGHICAKTEPVRVELIESRGWAATMDEIASALAGRIRSGDVVVVADKVVAAAQGRVAPRALLLSPDPKTIAADQLDALAAQWEERLGFLITPTHLLLADEYGVEHATVGARDHNVACAELAAVIQSRHNVRVDVIISDTDTGLDTRRPLIGTLTIAATPLGATKGVNLYEAMRCAVAAEFTRGHKLRIPIVVCIPAERRRHRIGVGDYRGYDGIIDATREEGLTYV